MFQVASVVAYILSRWLIDDRGGKKLIAALASYDSSSNASAYIMSVFAVAFGARIFHKMLKMVQRKKRLCDLAKVM